MPVGSAPAVDGLLHVTHDQVGLALRDAVGEERLEIAPLQQARVLRFVEHQVVVSVADLFIDERRVVVVDDAAQQVGRLAEQHDVVFLQVRREEAEDVGIDAKQRDVFLDQADASVFGQGLAAKLEGLCDAGLEFRALEAAVALVQALLGFGQRVPAAPAGPFLEDHEGAAALAFEIFRCAAARFHGRQRPLAQGRHFALEFAAHGLQNGAEAFDGVLVAQDVSRHAPEFQPEIFLEEELGHRLERLAHVPAASRFNQFERVVLQPGEQRRVGRVVQAVDQQVDDLLQHRACVELHPVGSVLPDFAGEGAHDALEEAVDGADGEAGVVVEDEAQALAGFFRPGVVAARECVQGFDHALFHLVGRLVGKGDGEDMLVALLVAREQQVDVFLRQPVGLTAAGRGFHHLHRFRRMFYRLHTRLKGQWPQMLSSAQSPAKGFSGLKISSTRACTRSANCASFSGSMAWASGCPLKISRRA